MKIWEKCWVGAWVVVCLLSISVGFARAAEPSLESWIQAQGSRSLARIYMAISPPDGGRGSVMASPSRSNPDYYYHWVRDSALVMKEVWAFRKANPQAKNTLIDYALFSRINQSTDNRSGPAVSTGLGEPKFEMSGQDWNHDWGRPQSDGPALRVIALLGLADDMMLSGQQDFVYKHLYAPEIPARTVIKADLEYVAHHWQDSSFDLWEEVKGDHFYTRIAQWRALYEGALFARKMHDDGASAFYAQQAQLVMKSLDGFFSAQRKYIVATRNWTGGHPQDEKPSLLDIAVILGALHSGKSGAPYNVDDDRVIATADALIQSFDSEYVLNRNRTNNEGLPMGPGIGRYPEDHYDGNSSNALGNPWFLATQGMAEYYLRLRGELKVRGLIRVTSLSRPFYEKLVGQSFSQVKALRLGDPMYAKILHALSEQSDAFIRRAKFHTGEGGRQSEQFNRFDGHMQGARDLTWSYASFLSLRRTREKNHE